MGTSQSETHPQRFRLPVRQPLRELLIASLCASIGSLEVIAWATFRLGPPLLIAGIVLILVGLGYGLWCLIRFWRTRWVVRLTAEELTVQNGSRRRSMPMSEVGDLKVERRKLTILDRRGQQRMSLAVDPTRPAHEALADLVRAVEVRRARS